jgi:hypothetical protein
MSCTSGLIWERKNEHHRWWDNRNRGTGVDCRTGEFDFMSDDEINDLIIEHYATSGEVNDVVTFARAIEQSTLTNQKAKWYQEGVEAGLRQALAEPPNSTTDVVEPEITQSQERTVRKFDMEYTILRLQELADYRLKLLTKMPSEWVGLTDEDIAVLRRNGAHSVSDTDFRFIEAKLKEKNCA